MSFDLVDLRLMTHIATAQSMTKGGELSHLSLSAASIRVKNLEDSINAKLLYRTSQGVTLTAAGEALVHHARLVLAQLDHLKGDMKEYSQGATGHLRVAANMTALGEFLPAVLKKYLSNHASVYLDLREKSSYEIVKAVTESHTDIGIIAGAVNTAALHTIPYRSDPLALVLPQGHPLAERKEVSFEETLIYDHVGLYEGSAFYEFLRGICDQLHTPWPLRIQVGNFETACRMTEATVGISIVPESIAARYSSALAINVIPLSDQWAIRQMKICARSFEELPAFARDFVELLAEDAEAASKG